MRSVSGSLFYSTVCSSLVLASVLMGCGDNGGGDTGTNAANATPASIDPTFDTSDTGPSTGTPATESDTSTVSGTQGTDTSATTADEPTAGTTMAIDPTTTTDPGTSTTSTTVDPSASSTTGEMPCDVTKATLKPVVPNIMLVLDKSGSMVTNPDGFWDHDADPNTPKITRWNSLYNVVKLVVTDYNDVINFGANLFPSTAAKKEYTAAACVVGMNVEIPVAPMNKDAILNGIPQAGDTSLVGGTPTAAGVAAALAHLKTLDPTIPRAMLLVTDGAANCASGAAPPPLFENYDQTVHTLVDNAWMVDKIPTYVVGIDTKDVVSNNVQDGNPNSINTYAKLNELATQGGKPKDDPVEKFYNAVNQIQLKTALDAIAMDAISCVIPLDEAPLSPDKTKVQIGVNEVPMVTDCATEDGWVYTNPMGPYDAIELCGTACEDLKIAKQADVLFFCQAG